MTRDDAPLNEARKQKYLQNDSAKAPRHLTVMKCSLSDEALLTVENARDEVLSGPCKSMG